MPRPHSTPGSTYLTLRALGRARLGNMINQASSGWPCASRHSPRPTVPLPILSVDAAAHRRIDLGRQVVQLLHAASGAEEVEQQDRAGAGGSVPRLVFDRVVEHE